MNNSTTTSNVFRARLLSVFTVAVTLILLTCVVYQVLNFRLSKSMDEAVDLVKTLNQLEQLSETYSMMGSQISQMPQSTHLEQNRKLLAVYLARAQQLTGEIGRTWPIPENLLLVQHGISSEVEKVLSPEANKAAIFSLSATFSQLSSEVSEELNKMSIGARARLKSNYDIIQTQKYRPLLMGLSLAFVFAAGLALLFFNVYGRFKKFIKNMSGVTEQAADGNLTARAQITGDDELGLVETQFNTMLGEIETLQSELERSNHDLEDFAQMASHDLQAPLRYISAYSDMITDKSQKFSEDEREVFSKNIQTSTARLSQLIADLLAYSKVRSENLERELCDVKELFVSLVTEAKVRYPGLDLEIIHSLHVPAYRRLLQTVFQNLLENTLKYSRRSDVRVKIDVAQVGNGYCIRYFDNGPGIPAADGERVFDLFHRRSEDGDLPGAGIGLAICKKIVSLHGGEITLEPSSEGVIFQILIPV